VANWSANATAPTLTDPSVAPTLSPDKQQESLEIIRSSGEVLASLIGNILDLSAVEAGKMQLTIEPFDSEPAFEYLSAIARTLAAESHKELDTPFTADRAITSITAIAAWNAMSPAAVGAPARPPPDAAELGSWVIRAVAAMATPNATATCRDVLNSDDARPIRSRGTAENSAVCIETMLKAMKQPRRNIRPRIHHRSVSRFTSKNNAVHSRRPLVPITRFNRAPSR